MAQSGPKGPPMSSPARVTRSGGVDGVRKVGCIPAIALRGMLDEAMDEPRAGSAGERRCRHAAPASGPVGALDRLSSAVLAVLAVVRERAWVPLAARVAPLRGRAGTRAAAAIAAFRAGPVLPWVAAHRGLVVIGGALVVSAAALAGTAAVIASPAPPPVADGSETGGLGDRPRPESGFTMPSPAPTSSTPTPQPTPTPTPTPLPAEPGATEPPTGSEPIPTPIPVEPTAEPEEPAPGNSGNSNGAGNRPDKTKG